MKDEIDASVIRTIESTQFINGPAVKEFEQLFSEYLGVKHVISVGNGTDALQIAFMALNYEEGDEIITPSFTYAATAEVLGLLNLTPVFVDVEKDSFNIDPRKIEKSISARTKAILPVHLFGAPANMDEIRLIADKYGLHIIEDTAQACGGDYKFNNSKTAKLGTIGEIGTFSFFPSKNLGCYGDGGAICTNDDQLAERLRMIARHGQKMKYHHEIIGCNSRLDTIQAAILLIKLRRLDEFNYKRNVAASIYNSLLEGISEVKAPLAVSKGLHGYHQYTIRAEKRDELQAYLLENGISSVVYYPIPLHLQRAFMNIPNRKGDLTVTEEISQTVLSLPIDTEITEEQQYYIVNTIKQFYKK